MSFSSKIKEDALVASGRCCCICHKFCGTKIEVHHIRQVSDNGEDTIDNAIPLCFDCHADMRSHDHKHPKGNKYSESELRQHRDNWYEKIKGNIGVADKQTVIETDKGVYQSLIKILPWDGSISFINDCNFAGFIFELSRLDDLYKFEDFCKNPAFEFIDPDLETLKAKLLGLIKKYTIRIATDTFATHTVGWNSVPNEWEYEQPERFEKVVTELHNTAEQIVETYRTLVKTSTHKLGILPPEIS